MHAKDFDSALVKRNRAFTHSSRTPTNFSTTNPSGAIGPPVTRKSFFDSLGQFSTSRGHAPVTRQNIIPPRPCLRRC